MWTSYRLWTYYLGSPKRLTGQKRQAALPIISFSGKKPPMGQKRLSQLLARLSPKTNTCPFGIVVFIERHKLNSDFLRQKYSTYGSSIDLPFKIISPFSLIKRHGHDPVRPWFSVQTTYEIGQVIQHGQIVFDNDDVLINRQQRSNYATRFQPASTEPSPKESYILKIISI